MDLALNPVLPPPTKDTVLIQPTSGVLTVRALRDVWRYRDLLTALATRDIKLRYRQTALGAIWVVLQPLIAAGIFSLIFGRVAKFPSNDVPYFIFSYASLLAWNTFSGALTRTSSSLIGNSQLVSKVYFPRLILPLSTVFSVLVDFGVALAMMFVLMICFHIAPTAALLLLPVWLLLITLLGMGFGLITSALSVTYRDVQYVLPVIVGFGLYATPVPYALSYALSETPSRYHAFFLINPLSGLLEAFRWSLLGAGSPAPPLGSLTYSIVAALAVFGIGAIAFKRMERKFADVI